MTIPTDVRAAARDLLFAMELGAHGPELWTKTQRLLHTLGDQTPQPSATPGHAARHILSMAVHANIIEEQDRRRMLNATVSQLWPIVRMLDGKLTMQAFQHEGAAGAALLYIVVLLLARAEQDVLLVH